MSMLENPRNLQVALCQDELVHHHVVHHHEVRVPDYVVLADLHKIYLMHGHGVLSRQWTRFSGFHPFPTVQMSKYFRAR
jgi:hypothetical protein